MNRRIISLFIILTAFSFTISMHAQDANSFYFMRGVPQNYQVNPAFQPDCNFFLGLPGLAPLKLNLNNSGFALGDVLQYSDNLDSLVLFLHPDGIGDEEFLNRLDENNTISAEFSTSLASFGFRAGKSYISFDIRERMDLRMNYNRDYLRLPLVGPDSGQFYDMGMGLNFSLMNELSMGVSRKFGDRLTVGLRGKILLGQANLNTERFDLTLSTNEDIWKVNNDISFNASLPYFVDYDYITFAYLAPIKLLFGDYEDFDPPSPSVDEIVNMAVNPKNIGLGLDLGVDFRMTDRLQLSASIVDLGSIRWKDNVLNVSHSVDYDFTGVEVYISEEGDFMETFLDSLEATYNKFTTTSAKYTSYLPTKLYLGGAFYAHPKISFGLLSRTDFFKGDIRQQFTASANLYPIRMISTTFSYSIIDQHYKNIGFGLALKAFPFNLYLLTDTGPSIYFFPTEARLFNFKIGMNLMFGCKKEKKAKTFDMPLIY